MALTFETTHQCVGWVCSYDEGEEKPYEVFKTEREAVMGMLEKINQNAVDASYMAFLDGVMNLHDDAQIEAFDKALHWREYVAEVTDRGFV